MAELKLTLKILLRWHNLPEFREAEREQIGRIIGLVQEHPEFFGAGIGDSALRAAADFLERLVAENATP